MKQEKNIDFVCTYYCCKRITPAWKVDQPAIIGCSSSRLGMPTNFYLIYLDFCSKINHDCHPNNKKYRKEEIRVDRHSIQHLPSNFLHRNTTTKGGLIRVSPFYLVIVLVSLPNKKWPFIGKDAFCLGSDKKNTKILMPYLITKWTIKI